MSRSNQNNCIQLRDFGQIAILGLGASSSFAEQPRCHKFSCAQSHPLPPSSRYRASHDAEKKSSTGSSQRVRSHLSVYLGLTHSHEILAQTTKLLISCIKTWQISSETQTKTSLEIILYICMYVCMYVCM